MAWCQIGNKPLSETVLTWFSDAHMQHPGGVTSSSLISVVLTYSFHTTMHSFAYEGNPGIDFHWNIKVVMLMTFSSLAALEEILVRPMMKRWSKWQHFVYHLISVQHYTVICNYISMQWIPTSLHPCHKYIASLHTHPISKQVIIKCSSVFQPHPLFRVLVC